MNSEALHDYVGAKADKSAFVDACWEEAVALVSRFVGTATVPEGVLNRACLETGAALFQRMKATNNQANGIVDGTPVFAAKDPMVNAYALLRPFVGWF